MVFMGRVSSLEMIFNFSLLRKMIFMIHLARSLLSWTGTGNGLQKLLDTSTIFRAKLIRLAIKYHISRVGHTEPGAELSFTKVG